MKKEIQEGMSWLVNTLCMSNLSDEWDNEDRIEHSKESFDKFYNHIKDHIDFNNLTTEEAAELRFVEFSSHLPNLWLIPLYLLPILPKGLRLTPLSGRDVWVGEDHIDDDCKNGCLAYGLIIEDVPLSPYMNSLINSEHMIECSACNGTGTFHDGDRSSWECHMCQGVGKVDRREL